MSDTLYGGRRFRTLNILDKGVREGLAIEIDTSLPVERAIKPDQNAVSERYNPTYRTEVLNAYVFESLEQVREISAEWLQSHNEERPHNALAGLPPATYRAQLEARSSPLTLSP
jgi:putative transposase